MRACQLLGTACTFQVCTQGSRYWPRAGVKDPNDHCEMDIGEGSVTWQLLSPISNRMDHYCILGPQVLLQLRSCTQEPSKVLDIM